MNLPGLSGLRHRALLAFFQRRVTVPPGRLLVSFRFDDFNHSAYVNGGQILRDAGCHGTFYAAMGLMNSGGDLFTSDDATRLVQEGHDLQCHTFGHLSSAHYKIDEYCADVERAQAAIRALRPDHQCDHFAYPYGLVSLRTKQRLRGLFATCRGIEGGLNGPDADFNLLRANRLYSQSVALENVRDLVTRARRSGGWLVFYTHDVVAQPGPYGCTPEYFQETVLFAKRAGAMMLTVSEAAAWLIRQGWTTTSAR